MSLKEYIANDIKNVFMDVNEFASDVIINGVQVRVSEDEDNLRYRIQKNYDGLVIGDVLFYITLEEYAKIPRMAQIPQPNQAIIYNGKPCVITQVNENMGMYEIVIQRAGGR